MCERAVQLSSYIDKWLAQEIALKATTSSTHSDDGRVEADFRDLKKLQLSHTEWHHLKMVTVLLKRFKTATNHLSQTKLPQICNIWGMYNTLFDFLDMMTEELGGNDNDNLEHPEWPAVVQAAAAKGREKLSKYYSKTDAERGFLFNCATILDPSQKLTAYEACYHS
jgi:hypothetical protein